MNNAVSNLRLHCSSMPNIMAFKTLNENGFLEFSCVKCQIFDCRSRGHWFEPHRAPSVFFFFPSLHHFYFSNIIFFRCSISHTVGTRYHCNCFFLQNDFFLFIISFNLYNFWYISASFFSSSTNALNQFANFKTQSHWY